MPPSDKQYTYTTAKFKEFNYQELDKICKKYNEINILDEENMKKYTNLKEIQERIEKYKKDNNTNEIKMNGTHRRNQDIIEKIIHENYIPRDIIEEVEEKDVDILNTITFKEKSEGKFKIMLDSSRYNYGYKLYEDIEVNGWQEIENKVKKGDYISITDFEECFHTIKLPEDIRRVMGFKINNRIYRYTRLPFGPRCGPLLIEKLCTPIMKEIEDRFNTRIVRNCDDIALLEEDRETCDIKTSRMREYLKELGFKISPKTLKGGTRTPEYLKRNIDTENLTYKFNKDRRKRGYEKLMNISKMKQEDKWLDEDKNKWKKVKNTRNGTIQSLFGQGNQDIYMKIYKYKRLEEPETLDNEYIAIEITKENIFYMNTKEIVDREIFTDGSKTGIGVYDETRNEEIIRKFEKDEDLSHTWISKIEGIAIKMGMEYAIKDKTKEVIRINNDNQIMVNRMINPSIGTTLAETVIKEIIKIYEDNKDKIWLFNWIPTHTNKADWLSRL